MPRKNIVMKAGDPVRLDDLLDLPHSAETTARATDRIMAAITAIVADLRDETPPAERFDPRAAAYARSATPTTRPAGHSRTTKRKRSR